MNYVITVGGFKEDNLIWHRGSGGSAKDYRWQWWHFEGEGCLHLDQTESIKHGLELLKP